jgi:hypothetical protein
MSVSNLPFTIFDFFAYLVPGAVLFVAFDYALNGEYFIKLVAAGQPPAALIIVLIIVAYMLGQINDSFARWWLNDELVDVILWQPSRALFQERKRWKWLNPILANYYIMLPPDVRKAVEDRMESASVDKETYGKADDSARANLRFMRALGALMLDKDATARLSVLETQYSFCRNLAIALFAFGFWLLLANHWHIPTYPLNWLFWGVVAGGTLMAGRFLRFYRQHAIVLFETFAQQPVSAPVTNPAPPQRDAAAAVQH